MTVEKDIFGKLSQNRAIDSFILKNKEYKLIANNGKNYFHGGIKGFNRVPWCGSEFEDGEEGYSGNLNVRG